MTSGLVATYCNMLPLISERRGGKSCQSEAHLENVEGRGKEAWIVDYVDQQGDRHIETFERKKEADAHQATVRVDVRKGIHVAASKSITVAEAAEVWIKRVEADERERTTVANIAST